MNKNDILDCIRCLLINNSNIECRHESDNPMITGVDSVRYINKELILKMESGRTYKISVEKENK